MSGPQMTSAPVLDGPLPVIMCIGDSLTEFASQPCGWASSLQNHYVSRRDVLLRGMSGYNSRWLRKCLTNILPQHRGRGDGQGNVSVMTLLVGTNDAVNPNAKSGPGWPQQHVPIDEYEGNVRAILDYLIEFRNADGSAPIVIVMSPPPQDGQAWHKVMMEMLGSAGGNTEDESPEQRSCEAVQPYAEAVQRVVDHANNRLIGEPRSGKDDKPSNRLAFIDLYNKMLEDSGGWQSFLSGDGVHFSRKGNEFLFRRISEALSVIEGSPDELPRHAPHFLDVDNAFDK